jgi:hypothetical protein
MMHVFKNQHAQLMDFILRGNRSPDPHIMSTLCVLVDPMRLPTENKHNTDAIMVKYMYTYIYYISKISDSHRDYIYIYIIYMPVTIVVSLNLNLPWFRFGRRVLRNTLQLAVRKISNKRTIASSHSSCIVV